MASQLDHVDIIRFSGFYLGGFKNYDQSQLRVLAGYTYLWLHHVSKRNHHHCRPRCHTDPGYYPSSKPLQPICLIYVSCSRKHSSSVNILGWLVQRLHLDSNDLALVSKSISRLQLSTDFKWLIPARKGTAYNRCQYFLWNCKVIRWGELSPFPDLALCELCNPHTTRPPANLS